MNRRPSSSALLFLAILMISTRAGALGCGNPTPVASIALTPPPGSFSGSSSATITVNFAGGLPTDCYTFVGFRSPNFVAGGPITMSLVGSYSGAGPFTSTIITHAVNQETTITISAFTQTALSGSTAVGAAQSASMTLLPLPLSTFTINGNEIGPNETATGRILMGGGTGGLSGLARVNLTANPPGAVTIPPFVDVGNEVTEIAPDRFTEYIATFTIAAAQVAAPTTVTITASRAGVTRTDTIRVMPPPCRVTVVLTPVDAAQPVARTTSDDTINALISNVGGTACPATTLAMRVYQDTRPAGPYTDLTPRTLEALAPGQQVSKAFVWYPAAGTGPRTFLLMFGPGYPGTKPLNKDLVLSLTEAQVNMLAER